MKVRSFLAVSGVLAAIALLAFGLTSKGSSSIAVGEQAPNGTLERLGTNGTAQISDYRGHWTLVNFWASWCGPCRSEAPLLERFWRAHRQQGTVVLGVNLDDNTDDANRFIDEFGLTYPQLRSADGSRWRDDYGMTGFPESFLLDPDGNLAMIRRGPVTESVLAQQVEPVIDGRLAPSGKS
jgi:cytochrome c biogenesis protein CcmG, thiol:disulfide interchange protein DsbE